MLEFERLIMLIGDTAAEKLRAAKVTVFGIGGVGGYAVEALARCGVGNFVLVDNDDVEITNLNRQIIALHSTLGKPKVDVARERVLDINPNASVTVHKTFFLDQTELIDDDSNYIIDAVDTVTAKIALVSAAKAKKIPIISSMGAGNKLNPALFEVCDIYKTSVCPLCRVMRRELMRREVDGLKVVYSKETPIKPQNGGTLGSSAFAPAAAGIIMAYEVVRTLAGL